MTDPQYLSDLLKQAESRLKKYQDQFLDNKAKLAAGEPLSNLNSLDTLINRAKYLSQKSKKDIPKVKFTERAFLEGIIGKEKTLLDTSFLEKGMQISASVCRISKLPHGKRDHRHSRKPKGSGFLVSKDLIITNNHVLPDFKSAKNAQAEFNYELDVDGDPKQVIIFDLEPDRFFYTYKPLDFTLVAVKPLSRSIPNDEEAESDQQESICSFKHLPLSFSSGKIANGEYLAVIQHPDGDYKKVAIRDHQLISMPDNTFLHYQTDTMKGSSGSPVFNNQWDVVALHHSGVPKIEDDQYVLHNGNRVPIGKLTIEQYRQLVFIANEGIRIERILEHLFREKGFNENELELLSILYDGQVPEAPQPEEIEKEGLPETSSPGNKGELSANLTKIAHWPTSYQQDSPKNSGNKIHIFSNWVSPEKMENLPSPTWHHQLTKFKAARNKAIDMEWLTGFTAVKVGMIGSPLLPHPKLDHLLAKEGVQFINMDTVDWSHKKNALLQTRCASILVGKRTGIPKDLNPGVFPYLDLHTMVVTEDPSHINSSEHFRDIVQQAVEENFPILTFNLAMAQHDQLTQAARIAYEAGVILICAVGDTSEENTGLKFPASTPGTISVSACGPDGQSWRWNPSETTVDISAPGHLLYLPTMDKEGQFTFGYGSSTAYGVSLVAGAAALWLHTHRKVLSDQYEFPWQRVEAFRTLLKNTAMKGVMDVAALVQAPLPEAESLTNIYI